MDEQREVRVYASWWFVSLRFREHVGLCVPRSLSVMSALIRFAVALAPRITLPNHERIAINLVLILSISLPFPVLIFT